MVKCGMQLINMSATNTSRSAVSCQAHVREALWQETRADAKRYCLSLDEMGRERAAKRRIGRLDLGDGVNKEPLRNLTGSLSVE